MKKLSTAQIKALRMIHEGRGTARLLHRNTRVSLEKRGLIAGDGLTARGSRLIADYLERTGDGPEDLKELLRFG